MGGGTSPLPDCNSTLSLAQPSAAASRGIQAGGRNLPKREYGDRTAPTSTHPLNVMTSAHPQEQFQSIEDELRNVGPAYDIPSSVVTDDGAWTGAQPPPPAEPLGEEPEKPYDSPQAAGPVRIPRSPLEIPLLGRVVLPASVLRISIAFCAFYTVASIGQKFGVVGKPYIPSIAAIAILVTVDQLRYCEFAKRKQFTVLFWVAIASLIVARSQFSSYSTIATVVLYAFCRVNSRAPKFLPADCAMGAIATWLFI